MKKKLLLSAVFFYCLAFIYAQPGELDSTFGANGIITADLGGSVFVSGSSNKVLLQSDGSMYFLLNQSATIISKRHSDGSRDLSYGQQSFSNPARIGGIDAVFQQDGKIVVAGSTTKENSVEFAIVRYNSDGALDTTFSGDGMQTTTFGSYSSATSIAIQNDGKIVVTGITRVGNKDDFAISRYNTDGSLDYTFSGDGKQITGTSANVYTSKAAIQSDGKIVVAGVDGNGGTLAWYKTDGTLENIFKVPFNCYSLAIQEDGKIVVAGEALTGISDFVIARYNTEGGLDSSFSDDGIQNTEFGTDEDGYPFSQASSLSIQSDGKIVVAGKAGDQYYDDFAIVRYNTDGNLDKSFSDDGKQIIDFAEVSSINSVAIQSDGKIIMIGNTYYICHRGEHCPYNFAAVRINTNGTLDTGFNGNGILSDVWPKGNTYFNSIAVQKDGKITAVGSDMIRYNTDGSLDKTFSDNGIQASVFGSFISTQADGKILVLSSYAITRYNINGSLDTTFYHTGTRIVNLGPHNNPNSLAIQSDGKIVIVGGGRNFVIARYNPDGTIDRTFSGSGRRMKDFGTSRCNATAVAIQSDGKIVAAGVAPTGISLDFVIARYNTNGTIDETFSGDGKQNTDFGNEVNLPSLSIQNDGKIVVAGSTVINSNYNFAMVRYNIDGTLDSSFSGDGKQNNDFGNKYNNVSALAIQTDGKILLGGYSGTSTENIVSVLVRYNTNGNLDRTFSSDGIQTTQVSPGKSLIASIAIANDKLYSAGVSYDTLNIGNKGIVARYLLEGESRTPPTVSITTPDNNAFYTSPANIKLKAIAEDAEGTISKVEFYNGNTLLHTETVAPYTYTWKDVPVGNYTLTAKATDNTGLVTTSAEVKISVILHKVPTVNITNPANNETFAGPTTIHLVAAAKDPDGTISKVEFYNGSALLHRETVAPYTYTWKDVPIGNYSLTAIATNNHGVTTISAVVDISVVPNKAPTVIILNPADSENFTAPANIPLLAFAQDPDGTISKVEFYNGGVLINTQYKSPYALTWKNIPAGTYTITAKTIDNLGLSDTSAPVTITVTSSNTSIVRSKPFSEISETGLNSAVGLQEWPNPARYIVNIHLNGLQQNKQATISVISASGVLKKTMQLKSSNQTVQLDVSSLISGMYIIKVISGDKVMYKQFVKL